jgi:hypothetical protein
MMSPHEIAPAESAQEVLSVGRIATPRPQFENPSGIDGVAKQMPFLPKPANKILADAMAGGNERPSAPCQTALAARAAAE